ncbi:MAG: type II toxin-antitoxin system VapC family toxin [Candidatus Thorarchaeota archaeon]
MIIVDSNIWAYYFDASTEEHKSVIRPLERVLRKNNVAVTAGIAMETVLYLVGRLGPLVGGRRAHTFLSYPMPIFALDVEILERAREKLCEFAHVEIGSREASILATMDAKGIDSIMTHDQAFRQVPDTRVIDPIK